ncbi:MAG: GNAT family N-acetyltransferase [Candidatus Heimdallarchaeota archaeon]
MVLQTVDSTWKKRLKHKITDAKTAIGKIKPGDRIFLGSGCAEPQLLMQTLLDKARAYAIADTEILKFMSLGLTPYEDQFKDKFRYNTFFIGSDGCRNAVAEARADYTPMRFSEIPDLFKSGQIPIDVALIQVTPPDTDDQCSLGVSVDIVKAAVENAKFVVAEANQKMPRVHGDSYVSTEQIDLFVPNNQPIIEVNQLKPSPDPVVYEIGRHVAQLIEDESTFHVGAGRTVNAILSCLEEKRDLGIHTCAVTDSIVELIEHGVVTNTKKTLHPHITIGSYAMGTKHLYNFLDDNPAVELWPGDYVSDPWVICKNQKMVTLTSAFEVDLTGQICSTSLGPLIYSGIGGAVDFIQGAARSKGGKSIVALPSTTRDGKKSRIVFRLSDGAGVMIPRCDVHYVVTEWGVAYLHGKSLRERILTMISIAAPRFRAELLQEAKKYGYIYPHQIEPPGYAIYPEKWQTTLPLDSGITIHFRPVRPDDESAVKEFFYAISPESRYLRFMRPLRIMSQRQIQEFANIDYGEHMTIIGVIQEEETAREKVIAMGNYYVLPESELFVLPTGNLAEVSLLVLDKFQNQGIGTFLLEFLGQIAQSFGIRGFVAEILFENTKVLHVIEKTNLKVTRKVGEGIYQVQMTF